MAADTTTGPAAAVGILEASAPRHSERFGWTVVAVTVGSVALAAVAGAGSAAPSEPLPWLLFVGSSVHVAATLGPFTCESVRAHVRDRRARFWWTPAGLLMAGVVLCLLPERTLSVTLLAFFTWQLWHYQKQNLGLAALAAASARGRARGRGLEPVVRGCIRVSAVGGVLALVAHPAVLQIVAWRPPETIALAAHSLAVAALAASVGTAIVGLARRGSSTPAPVAAVCLVAVAFPLPLVVASSPYAALGSLTLAHGLQYLLLVGHLVAGPPPRRPQADAARLLTTVAVVVAVGGLLSAVSHLHGDPRIVSRLLFGSYLAVVMTHFVIDGRLWRLRDEFPRRWLTERIPQLLGGPPGADASSNEVVCRL